MDTALSLGITTSQIDNLKFSFHCMSDEKDTKISLSVRKQ
jgi:hypothetical protein